MSWFWIVVIGTSIWVWVDARSIGARKGLVKGIADMGPFSWFLCCLFLWLIAFPIYLAKRGTIKAAASKASASAEQYTSALSNVADPSDLKKCPFCAEQIRVEAIKCKHCGSELQANA